MRIEYQGAVEVQPPFQHVGYVSAAARDRVLFAVSVTCVAVTAVLVLTLMAALIVRRRVPRGHAVATAVAVVVFGVLAAVFPALARAAGP